MGKCEFHLPNDSFSCGKSFQSQRLIFVSPIAKMPIIFHACINHCTLRIGVLSLAQKELQSKKDKNQIKWQEYKDAQSQIWRTCKRCNEPFLKEDVIWVIQYLKLTGEIQISVNKTFRVHQACAESEMRLYKKAEVKDKIRKLDSF